MISTVKNQTLPETKTSTGRTAMREEKAGDLSVGGGWKSSDDGTRGWFVIHRGDEILLNGQTPTTHADVYEAADAAIALGTELATRLAPDLGDEDALRRTLYRMHCEFG